MDWLQKYLKKDNDITYPDWDRIFKYTNEHYTEAQLDGVWDNIINQWTDGLCHELDGNYHKIETDNFIIISDQTESALEEYLGYIEFCLKKILTSLQNIAYKYENE